MLFIFASMSQNTILKRLLYEIMTDAGNGEQ